MIISPLLLHALSGSACNLFSKVRSQCANCQYLQSIRECSYCSELDGCEQALSSDKVLQGLLAKINNNNDIESIVNAMCKV